MRRQGKVVTWLVLTVALTACAVEEPSEEEPLASGEAITASGRGSGGCATPPVGGASPIAKVIAAAPSGGLKGVGEPAYTTNLRTNTPLYRGDLMRSPRGVAVRIQCCQGLTGWRVPDDAQPWGVANVCR